MVDASDAPRTCPCCGGSGTLSAVDLVRDGLSPMQRRIYDYLRTKPQGVDGLGRIVDAIYADDPAGGPLTAVNTVAQQVSLMRPKLACHGLRIGSRSGKRHAAGYGIWPAEQPQQKQRAASCD